MDPIVCVVELDKCDKTCVKGPHVRHILFNPWCSDSKVTVTVWGLPCIIGEVDLSLNILALLYYVSWVMYKDMHMYQ